MAWLPVFSTHFFLRGVGAALAHKKNWLEIREKCTHVELLKFFPEEIDGQVGSNFYKLDLTQKASVAYICNDFGAQFIFHGGNPTKISPKLVQMIFLKLEIKPLTISDLNIEILYLKLFLLWKTLKKWKSKTDARSPFFHENANHLLKPLKLLLWFWLPIFTSLIFFGNKIVLVALFYASQKNNW